MMKFKVEEKEIEVLGKECAKTLVIMHADHGEGVEVWEECQKLGCTEFALAAVSGIVWERDLSPWEAAPVFKKGDPFLGGADTYITQMEEKMIPEILEKIEQRPEKIVIAGYSLAGLFALYAAYKTDLFEGVVSASGSMWYPEFLAFVMEHQISEQVKCAYFSVGDKEAKTRNPVMQTVEENTEKIAEHLADSGIDTTFELNPGGHFVDDAKRMAKGIEWVLR